MKPAPQVHVDVKLHVFFADGLYELYFESSVRHGADVGQQLVVGEWGYGYLVGVKHIRSLRVVILGGKHQSVGEEAKVGTNVEYGLGFPFKVGVIVSHRT